MAPSSMLTLLIHPQVISLARSLPQPFAIGLFTTRMEQGC